MPPRDARALARILGAKAAGDEAALERLTGDPSVPDEVVAFHAQQAVEKRLKSVLASRGVAFERTHNIAYLLGLLTSAGIDSPSDADALSALTPWAASFRYEEKADESVLERDHTLELVRAFRAWAEDMFGSD